MKLIGQSGEKRQFDLKKKKNAFLAFFLPGHIRLGYIGFSQKNWLGSLAKGDSALGPLV